MEGGEVAATARTREGAAAWPARSRPLVGAAGSAVDARRKEEGGVVDARTTQATLDRVTRRRRTPARSCLAGGGAWTLPFAARSTGAEL